MEWITQICRTLIGRIGLRFYEGEANGVRCAMIFNTRTIYEKCSNQTKFLYGLVRHHLPKLLKIQTALLLSVHVSNKKSPQSFPCVAQPEGSSTKRWFDRYQALMPVSTYALPWSEQRAAAYEAGIRCFSKRRDYQIQPESTLGR